MGAIRSSLLLAAGLISQTAFASPSIVATAGIAEDANAFHLGVQLPLAPDWPLFRSEKVSAVLELSVGQWRGDSGSQENNRLIDVAALPALRYHPGGNRQQGFFVEGGIGAHLLSRTRIHADRRFGSAFQFGDLVGAGWRFGEGGRYETGLRLQHVSNGGIKKPNQGINFLEFRFVARF
jgi:lipid A 3-O-deacylase